MRFLESQLRRRHVAGVAAALVLAATPAAAQKLFKYQDPNGVWVYTDRRPESGQVFQETQVERTFEKPEVRLFQRAFDTGIALIAQNTYLRARADRVSPGRNGQRLAARSAARRLAHGSRARGHGALVVARKNPDAAMSFAYEFQFLPGDPNAEHRPEELYRLPFALATAFPVSQAYPDSITHRDPASLHAIDFVMPIGTGIYAARGGIVIEVASDYYDAGVDATVDGPRANMIRVLHDDGTMSLYAHMNWNSIRVLPGQRVERGEYLADSGNTGFSTGPHLHFAVQRNRGGAIVSVPVEFAGAGGAPSPFAHASNSRRTIRTAAGHSRQAPVPAVSRWRRRALRSERDRARGSWSPRTRRRRRCRGACVRLGGRAAVRRLLGSRR